jgi:hypothetical protein
LLRRGRDGLCMPILILQQASEIRQRQREYLSTPLWNMHIQLLTDLELKPVINDQVEITNVARQR